MTQDEIIEMARQAGIAKHGLGWTCWEGQLEAFVKLVAAKEREKVARWQIGSGYTTGHGDTIEDLLVELEWQVRESEREACAVIADSMDACQDGEIGKAIRSRGEA